MKKHNLYFEIKKNLVFSQLSFLSKYFYALKKMDRQIVINMKLTAFSQPLYLLMPACLEIKQNQKAFLMPPNFLLSPFHDKTLLYHQIKTS